MSKQTFVANTILTAAQMNTLQTNDYNQTVSTKTASYTLVATDAGTKIVMNAAGATTITVNTSLFSAGDNLTIANIGAGVCTVTAGTATVSSAGPLAIPQYGTGTLYFTSAGVSIYSPTAVTVASSSGLTFISGSALTGAATSVNNCFSATYLNYRVVINAAVTDGSRIRLRWRVGGTDNTSAKYSYVNFGQNTTSGAYFDNSPGLDVGFHAWTTGADGATGMSFGFDVFTPFAAFATHIGTSGPWQANNANGCINSGVFTDATSFDGFTLFPTANNLTGSVKIYGYANS